MLSPNRLAEHALKMLARISSRDVVLAHNKYLLVTSDAFLLKHIAFKRVVSV